MYLSKEEALEKNLDLSTTLISKRIFKERNGCWVTVINQTRNEFVSFLFYVKVEEFSIDTQ